MINDNGLLYIEPQQPPSAAPIIDELTCRMTANFRQPRATGIFDGTHLRPGATKGWHTCSCGAHSSNVDFMLPSGEITNSLCIHYLAYHRHEIPPEQLARVAALPPTRLNPTLAEIQGRQQ